MPNPKFILIDQSLLRVGGHHLEYARQVLMAAERAGFEPHLATHREFASLSELPAHWRVRPTYRHTSYSPFRYVAESAPTTPRSAFERACDWCRMYRGRQRRIAAFARNTVALLNEVRLVAGDHVFIPTLSELDLLGLGKLLRQLPAQAGVDWHVQFHFPIYKGYEPDYAAQEPKLRRMRNMVCRAAKLAAGHRLHFYTAAESLSVQFDRLGAASFHTLPYPVNPALRQRATQAANSRQSPLRIMFLGSVRQEKGYQLLPGIIDRLWTNYVAPGRICFLAQSDLELAVASAPENLEPVRARAALKCLPASAISLIDGPLNGDAVNRLLNESDIGLLPYDRQRYHARCSGPLVEFLVAGLPVVVPAGCWLADQLVAPNRKYHLALCNGPRSIGRAAAGRGSRIPLPPHAATIALLLRWPVGADLCSGAYARVGTTFLAADDSSLGCRPTIVGPARAGVLNTALLRVPEQAATVMLDWKSAYGSQRIDFSEAEVCFVARDAAGPLPLGAVGLAAVEVEDIATELAEVIDHYPHYRRTAQEFAEGWGAWHSPTQVVRELLSHAARGDDSASRSVEKASPGRFPRDPTLEQLPLAG